METPTPFDLNQELARWRAALATHPGVPESGRAELESHLLDSMETLRKAGLDDAEAFLVATRRVGPLPQLAAEFERARPGVAWLGRGQWMILGVAAFWVIGGVADLVNAVTLWLGSGAGSNGIVLGYGALALQLVVLLGLMGLIRHRVRGALGQGAHRSGPGRIGLWGWTLVLALVGGGLQLGATAVEAVALREAALPVYGQFILVSSYGSRWVNIAIVLGLAWWVARSMRRLRAVAMMVLLMLGCGADLAGRGDAGGGWIPRSMAAEQTPLEVCMAATDMTNAVDSLMKIDFSKGRLFTRGTALGFSELEFTKLPRAAMERVGDESLKQLSRIKVLAREVMTRRDQARAAGMTAKADEYTRVLTALGKRLQGEDQLKITQLVGAAVVKQAGK